MPQDTEKLLSTTEASEYLGLSGRTLESYRKEGVGPQYMSLGSPRKPTIRYRRQAIDDWLAVNTRATTPAVMEPVLVSASSPASCDRPVMSTDKKLPLAALRESKRWTISALAREVGLSRQAIYDIESGESWPMRANVELMAQAFGVPPVDVAVALFVEPGPSGVVG